MGELIVIFIIVLLLFGAKKLPELARGMGKSIKEFRKAASEMEEDFKSAMDATDPAKQKQKEREEGNKEVENRIAPPKNETKA